MSEYLCGILRIVVVQVLVWKYRRTTVTPIDYGLDIYPGRPTGLHWNVCKPPYIIVKYNVNIICIVDCFILHAKCNVREFELVTATANGRLSHPCAVRCRHSTRWAAAGRGRWSRAARHALQVAPPAYLHAKLCIIRISRCCARGPNRELVCWLHRVPSTRRILGQNDFGSFWAAAGFVWQSVRTPLTDPGRISTPNLCGEFGT